MKVLIAYMSQTGNTKKVAEAIYGAIPEPKEIKRVEDIASLDGYDLAFLGFPTHASGPDGKVKSFLGKHVKGKTIALFITHMAPEGVPELKEWLQNFRDAAAGANVVDVFDCTGEVRGFMKLLVRFHPDPHVRESIKTSEGKPDAARLERARAFVVQTMNKVKT